MEDAQRMRTGPWVGRPSNEPPILVTPERLIDIYTTLTRMDGKLDALSGMAHRLDALEERVAEIEKTEKHAGGVRSVLMRGFDMAWGVALAILGVAAVGWFK